MDKVVLAYSGGLDTSVILKWLIERKYEVIAYIADLGQQEDLEAARQKALKVGASKVLVEDLKRDFVDEIIFSALKASARYERRYLLGTSLARPLIARKQIEIAQNEKARFVSHGATGKGNDQVRFELTYYALKPDVQVLAPWKMEEFLDEFKGRPDMLRYAEKHKIPVTATAAKPYSVDANLMHISFEAGVLEDPAAAPPADMFKMTVSPQEAPDEVTPISVFFRRGVPVKVVNKRDGKTETDSLALFQYLNRLGGANGIGRIDLVENRYVGVKSRGVYETPGGTILWTAHDDLEAIALDREVLRLKEGLSSEFARPAYNGYWFSPEMELLKAAIEHTQQGVTGVVHIELYKGNATIVGREAENGGYNKELVSFDAAGGYNQKDAEGFIKINAVRLRGRGAKG